MNAVIDASHPEFGRHWANLIARDPLQNPLYAPTGLCVPRPSQQFHNLSYLVLEGDEPVIGCGLTRHTDPQGRLCLGYFGLEAVSFINRRQLSGPANSLDPGVIGVFKERLRKVLESERAEALEFFDPIACGLLSPMTEVLLERGGALKVLRNQRVELAYYEAQLWQSLSVSCRRLIEWGQQRLQIQLASGGALDVLRDRIDELSDEPGPSQRSGRDGLGQIHWQVCQSLLRAGHGFVVQGHERGRKTLNALFVHSDSVCHYVADDALVQPHRRALLASLIWQAMLHCKRLGCSHVDLGGLGFEGGVIRGDGRPPAGLDSKDFGGVAQTRLRVSLTEPGNDTTCALAVA